MFRTVCRLLWLCCVLVSAVHADAIEIDKPFVLKVGEGKVGEHKEGDGHAH